MAPSSRSAVLSGKPASALPVVLHGQIVGPMSATEIRRLNIRIGLRHRRGSGHHHSPAFETFEVETSDGQVNTTALSQTLTDVTKLRGMVRVVPNGSIVQSGAIIDRRTA